MEDASQEPLSSRDRNCPICGAKDYKWGGLRVGKDKPGSFVYFRPDGSIWEDGDVPIYVRCCVICGNIQMFEA